MRALVLAAALAGAAGCAAERPPEDPAAVRSPDLVEIVLLDATIRLDVRYATANNFLGRPVYEEARAFLQRPAALALVRVQGALAPRGLGLVVFDGYRPWSVTREFWDATPVDKKEYVADPRKGSRHNRGCAVDLSLCELATGKPLPMPSGYDEMTERAHVGFAGGSEESRANRDLLRVSMESEGYSGYSSEWWHFDYKDWREYPVLDVSFSEIRTKR